MSRTVRTIAFAAILVLTAASAAQASPPSAASIWDWVASWVSPSGWRPVWENEGCQMDPDGQCRPGEMRLDVPASRGLTPFWEKAGCQMDPDGKPCDTDEQAARDLAAGRNGLVRHTRN